MRHDAAQAQYREAEALLTTGGDRTRATGLLRDAATIAAELGARPLAAAVDELAMRARLDLDDTLHRSASPGPTGSGADPYHLSPREREVLAFVAQGRTNREIGDVLFISEKTVCVHVTHLLNKLGVSSRVEAALLADRAGIVP
jgi:DNA-binding NarL/FixJ family response regulator